MLSLLTSTHYEEIFTVHQNVGLQAFLEEVARRSHASGKSSRFQNLSMVFLPNVGQRPEIRTSSFAISHTCQAALPWGPRLAIGRRRHGPHQRRIGLDSHLRWRSGKGPQIERRLPGTQHRVGFAKFPAEVLPRRSVRALLWRTSVHTRSER